MLAPTGASGAARFFECALPPWPHRVPQEEEAVWIVHGKSMSERVQLDARVSVAHDEPVKLKACVGDAHHLQGNVVKVVIPIRVPGLAALAQLRLRPHAHMCRIHLFVHRRCYLVRNLEIPALLAVVQDCCRQLHSPTCSSPHECDHTMVPYHGQQTQGRSLVNANTNESSSRSERPRQRCLLCRLVAASGGGVGVGGGPAARRRLGGL